ncbi:DNA polymerase/3'-5' exonuclease PolX [Halocatena halophila]|uniref:DNA polymerase/3'-5' exonuclease PolX n=1 Tax=Halocatena halophila TaxID=2814576 RepID=UPI002ED568DF
MTSSNDELASLFEELADRLEAQDVAYKPTAYRRAAENIREFPDTVAALAETDGAEAVQQIDRVGEAIAEKIVEYVETGKIEELEAQREALPVDIAGLTSVEGVGPKSVGTLYSALGIETLSDLETAAEDEQIQTVSGFGPKTESNILENIEFAKRAQQRQLLGEALPIGTDLMAYLDEIAAVERCETAGSLRRWRETIGDVDVLIASDDPATVIDAVESWPAVENVIEAGSQKASVRTEGVRVDCRVVDPAEFGAALQYFTGSKEHNVQLRNHAIDRGLKVNEYGVFDVSAIDDPDAGQRVGERVAGSTERGVYNALGLSYVEPELREGRGEIEAATAGELPNLITPDDIRGDLHVHTTSSDGTESIESMVTAATDRGYEYLCITDHAAGPGMVGGVGLTDDELEAQLATVREIDDDADITVFAGVEANIHADGEISVSDDLLEQLDCVVGSPHAALDGDGTDRLLEAVNNPLVDVIGHPTGRLLGQRSGLDIDSSTLAIAAANTDTALEVNANPRRLDLDGTRVQAAIDAGATIAINTDAHRSESFGYVDYGVHTARRGWAQPDDVLNSHSVDAVRAFFDR